MVRILASKRDPVTLSRFSLSHHRMQEKITVATESSQKYEWLEGHDISIHRFG
ncbi:MAG: hypothetical protein OXI05_01715 [Bacteroidota bacterium]|nr:hypothetical protein [Bacteroidota bacterium]